MSKKASFDPTMIDTVIQDVKDLSAPAQKLVVDVVALLKGKQTMSAVEPVKCGDDGCKDCGQCLTCVQDHLVHALCATVQAQSCASAS